MVNEKVELPQIGNFSSVKFLSNYIFIARARRRKLNALKISLRGKPVELHKRKRHTELNVLVCCLSRVRKRAIHDGMEDNRRVSCTAAKPSSLRHHITVREASIMRLCNYSALKIFHAFNFPRCRQPTKYF